MRVLVREEKGGGENAPFFGLIFFRTFDYWYSSFLNIPYLYMKNGVSGCSSREELALCEPRLTRHSRVIKRHLVQTRSLRTRSRTVVPHWHRKKTTTSAPRGSSPCRSLSFILSFVLVQSFTRSSTHSLTHTPVQLTHPLTRSFLLFVVPITVLPFTSRSPFHPFTLSPFHPFALSPLVDA